MLFMTNNKINNINNSSTQESANVLFQECLHGIDLVTNHAIQVFDIVENVLFYPYDFQYIKSFVPLWMCNTGRTPESQLSKEIFEKLICSCKDELTNRILYWYDLQSIIVALQDRIESVKYIMEELYKLVPNHVIRNDRDYTSAVRVMNKKSTLVHTFINEIFVLLASSFDLFTKIVYELENLNTIDFSIYRELKSKGVLYSPNKIKNEKLKEEGLIFSKLPILRKVCSFRDFYVHNGAWDYRCTIYEAMIKGEPVDTFVLLPDVNEYGTFEKYKSRSMFYSKGEKINVTLPQMVLDIMKIYDNSIQLLIDLYSPKECEQGSVPDNFEVIVRNWNKAFWSINKKNI